MSNCAKKKKKKGFTLIELLVVIAIIGILATIVIINVNNARIKANDVAVKAALEQVRAVAELHYDTNGTYVGFNGAGTEYTDRISPAIIANGGTVAGINVATSTYCVSASLRGGGAWCVDSTGINSGTLTTCDASSTCY